MNLSDPKEVAKRWDLTAPLHLRDHEDSEGGDIRRRFHNPAIFRMLGEVTSLAILDLGSGEGYLSRMLALRGAKVTGIDLSSEMLKASQEKERQNPLGIKYELGNCSDLSIFGDNSFDIAVSNMVLIDISDLDGTLYEVHRVLKPKGRFLYSILNPMLFSPGSEDIPAPEGKAVDYFSEGAYELPLEGYDTKMIHFHRTLSTYLNKTIESGFTIKQIDEPDMAYENHEERQRYPRPGLFLFVLAVRP